MTRRPRRNHSLAFKAKVALADKLSPDDVEIVREIFNTPLTGSYNWDYESANVKIQRLYELGKKFICMQILFEGLALSAFQTLAATTRDPLLRQAVTLVMRDEGRHVAFGDHYLEDWIKELPEDQIEERAQFAYEACAIMRERLFSTVTEKEYGFDPEEARRISIDSENGQAFRNFLFERMAPNLKRVGLLTETVRPKFEARGVLHYENAASDAEIDWHSLERPLEVGVQTAAE